MITKIGETLLGLVIPALFTFLSGWAIAYFFSYSSVVTVGETTKLVENQFILPINLNAYKDINNLRITIPGKLSEQQIKTNKPVKIKLIDNNIGIENGTVLEIEKVFSNSNVELIVETNTSIDDKDIVINSNGNKVEVKYASEVVNPVEAQRKSIITNAILYALVLGGITFWADSRRDKKLQKAKEERESIIKTYEDSKKGLLESFAIREKAMLKTEEQVEELSKRLDKNDNNNRKRNILLLAKLNDYRKELNFWRDTIRKVIYQLPNGEMKAEQLIKTVSLSLKTYQTHGKDEHDYESLKVLSNMIKDMDENN